MNIDPLTNELRQFVLNYAEHDIDCLGINTRAWEEQRRVCACGLTHRLDDLLERLDGRLRPNTAGRWVKRSVPARDGD